MLRRTRRAAVDPRLINERRQDTAKDKQIALTGTFHFGETC